MQNGFLKKQECKKIHNINNTTFDDIDLIIKNHRALNHTLFEYLKDEARVGYTSRQFDIYRCNFFYRTSNTIPCIARLVAAAAANLDIDTLASAGKNLYEETGSGDPTKAHCYLLETSHNSHANHIFGLDYMSFPDAAVSNLLLPEAVLFEGSIHSLYNHHIYATIVGAAYAHEMAANNMLINFYEGFFVNYRNYYSLPEFYNISEYFLAHITGLENAHAQDAKLVVQRLAVTKNNLQNILQGVFGFLNAQALLWDGIYRELKKSENIGNVIAFNKLLNPQNVTKVALA